MRGARQRLLREQPAGDLRAAGVRDPQPDGTSTATASTAGASRPATAPAGRSARSNGVERRVLRLHRAQRAPFGPDDGTVAPWVVVASLPFAPEIVIPDGAQLCPDGPGHDGKYGFKPSFNQTFAVAGESDRLVGHALSLRHRSGAGRADDRELPHRAALEHHASLSRRRHGTSSRGIHGGLALASVPIAS